jgi:hypothetical protein
VSAATKQTKAPAETPPDVDLRPYLGPTVLDQGSRPTCATFATSACHEAVTAHRNGVDPAAQDPTPVEHYAPEAIWWYCTQQGWAGANGLTIPNVMAAVADSGQPFLSAWPYDATLGDGTEDPPAAAEAARPWDRAEFRRLALAHDGVEAGLEATLASGYPVLLGVQVTNEFYSPDAQGRIEVPASRSRGLGGHAITAVGAATLPGWGRHVLIKNSWGEGWGAGGYAFLPFDYLRNYAIDAAEPVPV